jgi:nucleotide-binding universal stress UspA family protein
MLNEMRKAATNRPDDQTIDHSVEYRSDQADAPSKRERWIGDDTVLAAYIGSKVKERTSGLVAALNAAGVEAEVVGEEGESASKTVLAAAESRNVDVLCIGSRGAGLFEGLLGSTSTKIARLASCPVLIIR